MKKKQPSKVYRLVVPIYGVVVWVAFDSKAMQKKFNLDDMSGNHCAEVFKITRDDGYQSICMVFRKDHFSQEILTHESVHVAWRVLDIVGIEVNSENHEALAYVAGWFAEEVNKIYFKKIKK
jgi:hypothetical protein